MATTIGGMPAARYLKQFFIGLLIAAIFMLICRANLQGKQIMVMTAAVFALLNTVCYPYSHLVLEKIDRYFRSSKSDTRNNDSRQTSNTDDGTDLESFLFLVALLAFGYFLLFAASRVVFWLLALPLTYYGFGLLQAESTAGS